MTATKKPARRAATSAAQDVAARYEVAEELLGRFAGGEHLAPEEHLLFRSVGWDAETVAKHRDRVAGVRRHQARAGTGAEFETAKQRLADADEHKAKQLPLIAEEIAKLEAVVQELTEEHRQAAAAVREMESGRAALRNPRMLPFHVAEELQLVESTYKRGPGHRISELETRIRGLEGRLELQWTEDVNSSAYRSIALICGQLPPSHPARPQTSRHPTEMPRSSASGWQQVLEETREELAEARAEREQLVADTEDTRAKLADLADYYVGQL